ncbi:flippase-like domain-containing protein [Pedobacter sp. SD-b]|uniref:Flippase-like domain-containing protein n=1 Tax=Pedobacter segetis TaxID=2793069 RepID=A0ABS1BMZ4_9SPHI|nr:lysylphosphatidylglycerol synthase domain-containing protein [Pedobacter segetis]MBK0384111.1 flippase-like domain-containing protein [Pedobacter segetis]
MTKHQKKILGYCFKIIIVALAAYFIYHKLSDNTNLKNFLNLIHQLNIVKVWAVIGLVLLLMFANWLLESAKWMFLVRKIEIISFYKAVESVFCGLTWAIFTPNRIGEYGGRIFFLSSRKRIKGMVAMSVGQIAQMVITNVLGALALLWFIYNFKPLDQWLFIAICVLVMGFCFFFLLFYFNIRWLEKSLNSIKFLRRFKSFFSVLSDYHKSELAKVMLYSLARFAVFTSQYLMVIHLLIPAIPYYESALMVFLLFFIQSALPSLDLLDVGVRSLTATYFFSFITHQEIAVMAAAALIWLVNLIIPAVLGSYFVFKLNFFDHHNS